MEKFDKIVLNIPHSSINGVFYKDGGWNYNANLINAVMKEIDWHTDFIFNDERSNIIPCVFDYSRFFIDVERLENDPLEGKGRGIIYSDVNGHKRNVSETQANALYNIRKTFLQKLSDNITSETLVIDCHSFNEEVAKDVDICIGYNEDWSKPSTDFINGIISIFEDAGYRVGVNHPYSNSITPDADCKYKSIMIEVNKKLYLRNGNEINTDTKFAPKLSNTIKKVYNFVLK